ncbi:MULTISPECIES: hypothetical protein [Cupriavidus]
MKKLYERLMVMTMIGYAGIGSAQAQQNFSLSDIKNTSGAGSNDLSTTFTKGQQTAQNGINLWIILFTALGVIIFCLSLYGLYKAGKEDRENPKGAFVGLFVGAAMTIATLLLGLTRNTIAS